MLRRSLASLLLIFIVLPAAARPDSLRFGFFAGTSVMIGDRVYRQSDNPYGNNSWKLSSRPGLSAGASLFVESRDFVPLQVDLGVERFDLEERRHEVSRHVSEGYEHIAQVTAVQVTTLFHSLSTSNAHFSLGAELLFSVHARASGRAFYSNVMHAPSNYDTAYTNKSVAGPAIFGPCMQFGFGFHVRRIPCSLNFRGGFSLFSIMRMNASAVLAVYPFGKK